MTGLLDRFHLWLLDWLFIHDLSMELDKATTSISSNEYDIGELLCMIEALERKVSSLEDNTVDNDDFVGALDSIAILETTVREMNNE